MSPKVVDLFCGAGGLTRGFADEGFDVVAGIDVDTNAAYAYGSNNDAEFLPLDIRSVTSEHLDFLFSGASHRVLAGCAPCQAFSSYTQRSKEANDGRWELLNEFARLVEQSTPDIVTMENVPQLRRHARFHDFLAVLFLCGYWIWCDVVECQRYGVPQTRKRLVLLASKLGPIRLIAPTHETPLTVREVLEDFPVLQSGGVDPNDPLHRASSLSSRNLERLKVSTPGGTWREWPDHLRAKCHRTDIRMSYVSVYGRMEWNKPAPTITTEFYGIGHGRFGHPDQDRAISLREGATLQTFPKSYMFSRNGLNRIAPTSRLIGNAVPVALARAIAVSIRNHLKAI